MAKTFTENVDNVVFLEAHRQIELATSPDDPSGDWLRTLPHGARFLCKRKDATQSSFIFELYGIAAWTPKAVLLWNLNEMQAPVWVDSEKFSKAYRYVETLPEKPAQPDKEAGP